MSLRLHACLAAFLLGALALPARAEGCDALAARMIRATGASLAGRAGRLVVFRAFDADRMSLSCGPAPVLVLRADRREPLRPYFILIGLAGQALAGGSADAIEALALTLHQATLLTGLPQQGRSGRLAVRCETGDRIDGFHQGALCRLTPTAAGRRAGFAVRDGRARAG